MLDLVQFKAKLAGQGTTVWIDAPSVEYFWVFKMTSRRADVWPYLCDTSRFNRELGFVPREQIEVDGKQVVKTTMLGLRQEWIEEPWSWVAGQTMVSTREYIRGMARNVQSVFHLEDEGDSTLIYVYFGWQPTSRAWGWFLSACAGIMQKKFASAFTKIDGLITTAHDRSFNALIARAPILTVSAQTRLSEFSLALGEKNVSSLAVDALRDTITHGDDLDIESIRVVPLARRYGITTEELLKACLTATQLGLLNISWEVVCPHCRGSRYSASSLGDIPATSSCDVCDIEFGTDGAESIEVLFHVHESIRNIPKLLFCAAEPAKKSHIKLQQSVTPGQIVDVTLNLESGNYRARWMGIMNEARFTVDPSSPNGDFELNPELNKIWPQRMGPDCHLVYKNNEPETRQLIVENLWWDDRVLKPADVLALPQFRELFSDEYLQTNVKLYLGEQTILFTDIVGSTQFYSEVGDAKAFAEVRAHFQELYKLIHDHGGVVVKTIGDAVMASFANIQDALNGAVEIQKLFTPEKRQSPVRLRIAVHAGPVIAVQLNTGLDYFGNTVNLAAKFQSVAGAGEIAMSSPVYEVYKSSLGTTFPVERRHNGRDGASSADVFVAQVSAQKGKVSLVPLKSLRIS